ncbi:MAG TPA: cytochrome c [Pyrinomonadaceae bacterium]|nr:cytochrome c [Pyrinomonadaceae bacterium]
MKRTASGLPAAGLGLLVSVFLLVESTKITEASRQRTSKSTNARVDDLYRANCARCHGAGGRGDTPLGETYKAPDFTDSDWWREHSDITGSKSLISIVTNGKGEMPAFGKKLKNSEIKLLVNYVRRFRDAK